MDRKNSFLYSVVLFIYILLVPFYKTAYIPVERTFVLFPFVVFILSADFTFDKRILQNSIIHRYLGLFFFLALASCLYAVNVGFAAEQILVYLMYFAFYIIVIKTAVSAKSTLEIIYWSLLVGLLLSIALGYLQFSGHKQFYIVNEEDLNGNTGLEKDALESLRAWGTFGNSLMYADYLSVIGILVSIYYLSKPQPNYTLISIVLSVAIIIGLLVSGGRTATATYVICYMAGFYYIKKRQRQSFFLFLVGILILLVLYGSLFFETNIYSRFLTTQADFKEGRLEIWIRGWNIFLDNPLFGAGAGNIGQALSIQKGVASTKYGGHVENVYLTILATYGIIGFTIFILLIRGSILTLRKYIKEHPLDNIYKPFAISVLFGWVAMIINMITDPAVVTNDARLALVFMLLLALPTIVIWKARTNNVIA